MVTLSRICVFAKPRIRGLLFTYCALGAAAATVQTQTDNDTLANKAVEAERQGDFAGAVSAFQQLIRNGADGPELRSNLAIAYFQLHEYRDALRQFQYALKQTPDSVPANLFSGLCLLKLQRAKDAIPFLARARAAQPGSTDIALALAQAEIAAQDLARAQSLYTEVTRLDPQNAEAWYGLGITERALAEQRLKQSNGTARQESRVLLDESQTAIAKAMQLDPGSVKSHMVLGESFRIAEQYDNAVREYKAATEQQPNLAPAWAGLASAYSAGGDDQNALRAATQALALDPHDADTNALIAATFLRQGDYAKAQPYALHAIELQPTLSAGHVVLAKIYLAQQQPQKALPELQSAVKDDTDGATYYLLATTFRQLGRPADASAAMQTYRQLHNAHVAAPSK